MTHRRLINIIEGGESLTVEFKQRFTTHEKIAKEMIALANTSGGVLIIGVNDDGSICGVYSEKEDTELLKQTATQYCEPPLDIDIISLDFNDYEVVVAVIDEANHKPIRLQDYQKELDIRSAQVFVRIADKSVLASKEMIKILQAKASGAGLVNYEIGKTEKVVFEYLDSNERISVKILSEIANISRRRASRTLIKLVRANLLLIHTKDNGEDFFTYAG